jgi:catechol 2,3-dioxygenase-like lactoylglutathione lyase family enzyme
MTTTRPKSRGALGAALALALVLAAAGQESGMDDRAVPFQPGALVQFAVSDLDRSVAFYRDVLGLKMNLRNDALSWAKFDTALPGLTLGIGQSETVEGSGTTSLNLTVGDADAARELLESRGVVFKGDTVRIPGVVTLADFTDPDGNLIRLAGPPTG